MIKILRGIFAPSPFLASDDTESQVDLNKRYKKLRLQVFLSATFGYGFYYVCRLSLNVMKKPLVDNHILNESQLGIIGSALFIAYAIGKFVNGFLIDKSNIKKFMAFGLLVSAIINIMLGFTGSFLFFAILWALNGWFQSMGAPPAIVSLSRWFNKNDRGTYYGFFSASHNIGEAFTYVFTALTVSYFGWQLGFVSTAVAGFLGVTIILIFLHDSPESKGLPRIMENIPNQDIGGLQLQVLKSPAIWILAISSAFMYISRYAITSWGIFFLQEQRHYSALIASSIISVSAVSGIFGNIFSGWVSDTVFKGKRNIPALIFGVLNAASLAVFLYIPNGNKWVEIVAMVVFGFSIGVLICYLAGLMAVDMVHKSVSGAAIGVVGIASYIGAGIQDVISGYIIKSSKITLNGLEAYDFSNLSIFWVGSAILSFILCLFIWNVKVNDN
jgi:OPA family sugar phosphate sensor protein UhpC-like MFS transporter